MPSPRYLTKSRFKLGLECSTKLFYTKKPEYADKKIDDKFLVALANGGFQVGELAKCYFPNGHDIESLDFDIALQQTNQLLLQENVIIYEAAFLYENLFIRSDILVKEGARISLYEVKAKSADSVQEKLLTNKGTIAAGWKPYLYDIAFQKYVISKSLPDYSVNAFLIVADKSALTTVEGLNQKFLLENKEGNTSITVVGDVSHEALGRQILCKIPVDYIIETIFSAPIFDPYTSQSFTDLIHFYADHYLKDQLIQAKLTSGCALCEFRTNAEQESKGLKSGFKECWTRVNHFSEKDFLKPSVLDIWNLRSKDSLLQQNKFFQTDVNPDDFKSKKDNNEPGLSTSERQILQITKTLNNDLNVYIDLQGLKKEFDTFTYPLHFIDFETSAVAIPFNSNKAPYEQIAFQFSHHIVYKDGKIEHKGQWINTEQGKFPNFDFVRNLKAELELDQGTIFRYAPHENTILNAIYKQLLASSETDREALSTWIKTITKSTSASAEQWIGERNMVDMLELVKKYYYAPETNGSNSIKAVLPAVLNQSDYLKAKYSKPIYGDKIRSLNFQGKVWIALDEGGNVINPYKHLEPIFKGVDTELLDSMLSSLDAEVSDGGAAMTAYAQMQFTQMEDVERKFITNSLLKYCELDTLAMVLIWEEWNHKIKNI